MMPVRWPWRLASGWGQQPLSAWSYGDPATPWWRRA